MFTPSNELTFQTVQENRRNFIVVLNKHTDPTISICLKDVTVCDSAGLASLLEAKRLCLAQHKTLMLFEIPKVVSSWVEFCGLTTLL